jgi:hypothetical protein
LGGVSDNTQKVYVALLGEGVDVWRPIEAEPIEADVFRITSEITDPEEVWQFLPGEFVRCEEREFPEQGAALVATEKAEVPGRKQPFLVVYDYGQGGLWALLHATSVDDIHRRYSELEVFARVPDWMRADMLRLVRSESYDIEQPPTGLLASLLEARACR